jgi:hypothetical protein
LSAVVGTPTNQGAIVGEFLRPFVCRHGRSKRNLKLAPPPIKRVIVGDSGSEFLRPFVCRRWHPHQSRGHRTHGFTGVVAIKFVPLVLKRARAMKFSVADVVRAYVPR